jgi:hypothetical protein
MVTQPIEYYEATKVHIIHYIKNPDSERGIVYSKFCDRVCDIISAIPGRNVEIVKHNIKITDFTTVLRSLLSIIEKERSDDEFSDIFVNVSSGSSEYVGAGMVASMMIPGTIPFTVRTKTFKIEGKDVYDTFFDNDGNPIGLTVDTYEPTRMPAFHIEMPEKNLILGLRILHQMSDNKYPPKSSDVIRELIAKGIWTRREELDISKTSEPEDKLKKSRSDAVYYMRDYVSKWLLNGWIYKDEHRRRYFLTDAGRTALDTFYVDEKL